jgi:hypothetical protein
VPHALCPPRVLLRAAGPWSEDFAILLIRLQEKYQTPGVHERQKKPRSLKKYKICAITCKKIVYYLIFMMLSISVVQVSINHPCMGGRPTGDSLG